MAVVCGAGLSVSGLSGLAAFDSSGILHEPLGFA